MWVRVPTSRSHAIVSSVQPCQAAFGPLQCNSSWSEPILSESRVHTHAWRLPLCPAWWFGIEEVEVLSGLHQVIGLALPSHTQPILSCKYKYRHQPKCRCHATGLAALLFHAKPLPSRLNPFGSLFLIFYRTRVRSLGMLVSD